MFVWLRGEWYEWFVKVVVANEAYCASGKHLFGADHHVIRIHKARAWDSSYIRP
jgi:hypothetical protein